MLIDLISSIERGAKAAYKAQFWKIHRPEAVGSRLSHV